MPIYTLLPNAVWAYGSNFAVTGAPTAVAALSDNADSSYIQKASSAEGASLVEFEFTTQTIPVNERIVKVNFRVRASRQANTGALSISSGYVKDRNSKTAKYSASTVISLATAPATVDTGINLTYDPDGIAWGQPAIDDLLIRITDTAGGVSRAKIYEVYADVFTTTKPTVSVIAPAGTVSDTSFPAVAWAYADAENDTQFAYQVKIFDSAAYLSSSFDVDKSPATVNTGVVYTSDTGASLTVDLANSTTFRAYVKVAQAVNGSAYWSDWASSQFVTNLDAPNAPLLAASFDTVESAVLIKVQGTTNLLSAESASIETDTSGWVSDTNCSFQRDTSQSAIGSSSLQLSAVSSGEMVARTAVASAVRANTSYSATASVKAGTSTRLSKVGILWLNASGAVISTSYGASASDSASVWTVLTVTATAPATAVTACAVVAIAGNSSGEKHFLDKVAFHSGTVATWSAGGFRNFTFDIEKSADEGATYSAIRNSPVVSDIHQSVAVYDYEAPVGIVKYRAKAKADRNV